jgi:hypothetical protein
MKLFETVLDGWMDEWVEAKAVLYIAYSITKYQKTYYINQYETNYLEEMLF